MVAAVVGCHSVASPSERQTETLTGTVQPGMTSAVQTFTVSKRGELDIKLSTLTPPFASRLLLLLGPQTSGSCSLGSQQFVLVGTNISYGLVDAGVYCVVLADTNTLTTTESFTLTVVHS